MGILEFSTRLRKVAPKYPMLLSLTLILLLLTACRPLIPVPLPRIVKIGLIAPFEGRYRYIGYDAIYAARMAVREINAGGGVDGLRLELVAYDDRGEPELAARIAYNLVVDPDVLVVLGHYRSATSAAAAPIYAEAGLTHIVMGGWVPESAYTRHLMPDPDIAAQAMLSVGLEGDQQTAAIWSEAGGDTVLAAALLQTVQAAPLATAAPDASKADLVFTTLSPVATAGRLLELDDGGWEGRLIGAGDLAASAFGRIGGLTVTGSAFITPYPFPRDLAGTEAWATAYRAVGPHVPEPGPHALPTYEAVGLVVDALGLAISEGGALDRTVLGDALTETRHTGLLGEIEFDGRGFWQAAPLYHYRWTPVGPELVQVLR